MAHAKQRFRELNIMKFECINIYLTGIFAYKAINKFLPEIYFCYVLKITDKYKYSTRATSDQRLIVKFARTTIVNLHWLLGDLRYGMIYLFP